MKVIALLIFRILRSHDVITILCWTYEFRFEIRVLNVVYMLNLTHNLKYGLRYCNVAQKECIIFRPSA